MSQHHVISSYNGRPVAILAGWDRPLRCAFMCVEYAAPAEGDPEMIYSNLTDADALTYIEDVDYFIAILSQLGIESPLAMWEAIAMECSLGGSTRVVHYDLSGAVLSDSSQ
jgi:hypothetical protein